MKHDDIDVWHEFVEAMTGTSRLEGKARTRQALTRFAFGVTVGFVVVMLLGVMGWIEHP